MVLFDQVVFFLCPKLAASRSSLTRNSFSIITLIRVSKYICPNCDTEKDAGALITENVNFVVEILRKI